MTDGGGSVNRSSLTARPRLGTVAESIHAPQVKGAEAMTTVTFARPRLPGTTTRS